MFRRIMNKMSFRNIGHFFKNMDSSQIWG
jgi:hypothetical protein